jgi:hypothetical protein
VSPARDIGGREESYIQEENKILDICINIKESNKYETKRFNW